jgi:hypothetical protein
MFSLVELIKATTGNAGQFTYTIKVHGHDGLIRNEVLNVIHATDRYGKLRMKGSRFAVRQLKFGSYRPVSESEYSQLLSNWLSKRAIN